MEVCKWGLLIKVKGRPFVMMRVCLFCQVLEGGGPDKDVRQSQIPGV